MRVIEYRRRAMSQPPLPESLQRAWKSYAAAHKRLAEAMEATIKGSGGGDVPGLVPWDRGSEPSKLVPWE